MAKSDCAKCRHAVKLGNPVVPRFATFEVTHYCALPDESWLNTASAMTPIAPKNMVQEPPCSGFEEAGEAAKSDWPTFETRRNDEHTCETCSFGAFADPSEPGGVCTFGGRAHETRRYDSCNDHPARKEVAE